MNHNTDTHNRQKAQHLEMLIQGIDDIPDPKAQEHIRALVQALMDFHGAALTQITEHLQKSGQTGNALLTQMAKDELISSVLLLYGLHPDEMETRVRRALDKVQPNLRKHGGRAEMLQISGGTVRVRMLEDCNGCSSSALTIKHLIEEAVYAAAPEATSLIVEGELEAIKAANGKLGLPIV